MIAYINTSTDPYYNLALEEHFLKNENITEDILLFWQNHHTIVIGKNQNAYGEINQSFVDEAKIQVVRRLSGGGAVYHDDGNLNFTIIKQDAKKFQNDFSYFTEPVVSTLQSLGLPATFSGRNDLLLDGHKISGNAQYNYKDRQLNHGTLLFDSDLSVLSKALTPKPEKYESRGVKSVQSRVTNIRSYDETLTMDKFKDTLLKHFFPQGEPNLYVLSDEEKKEIMVLRDEKYSSWEWVFGRSPAMDTVKGRRFPAGTIEIHFSTANGIITDILITGDYFEIKPVSLLHDSLLNQEYKKENIRLALKDNPVEEIIHNWSTDELIDLLFE